MAGGTQPQPIPPKEEMVAKLKEGQEAWNEWIKTVPDEKRRLVDLSEANLERCPLEQIDLRGVNLSSANLGHAGSGFAGANFTNAYLDWANLSGATLPDSKFDGAHLVSVDLSGAHLAGASFKQADLYNASLRDAYLRGADLSEVKEGLLPDQLSGADLTAAKLPEPTAKLFEKLGSGSEISDSAKKLFLALLAACLYSWLTIGTTKDVDLITNRASSPLPIIQTALPIVGFYVVAPIILLCVYFYFHFYLQKLWEELAQLPAIFQDGRPLYARDPWLFNDWIRGHLSRLKEERPFLSYCQQFISILLAWWLVPITLFLFWGRYLPRHDMIWTTVLALILAISIVSAIQLYRLAKGTLRGNQRKEFQWKLFWKYRDSWYCHPILKKPRIYVDLVTLIALITLSIVMSRAAILGSTDGWVARAMGWIGYSAFANVQDADVSVKPPNWTGKKDEELDLVKGAILSGKDLRYANAQRAFLVKADLKGADLTKTDLTDAHLSHAVLFEASMNNAKLKRADLRDTNLDSAKLHSADFIQAYLARASLVKADLSKADLSGADLIGADLRLADLRRATVYRTNLKEVSLAGADLTDALFYQANLKYANLRFIKGLTPANIKNCWDYEMAFYDEDMLKQLGFSADHNAKLEKQQKAEQEQQKNAVAPETRPKQP